MAEMAGDPYGYDERGGRGWRRQFAGALGGACAIALVWGLVSWGHGLLTRDSGQIPFLRAEEGPMKIVPEDPGGLKLARTDMAVSRIVGGTGASAVEPGLAPQPEALSEEDQPQPYLAARDPGAATSGEGEADATPTPAVMPAPDADAIDRAVARVLQEQAMESSDGSTAEAEESSSLSAVAAPPPPLRPRAPTRAEMAAAAAAAAAAQPAPVVAASSMAAGDIGIQLGAFNSESIAQSQWRRALRRHEDLLGALAHAVTTVDSGGRTLYRLRAGPVADRRKAQELCAALKSRGEACIVATIR